MSNTIKVGDYLYFAGCSPVWGKLLVTKINKDTLYLKDVKGITARVKASSINKVTRITWIPSSDITVFVKYKYQALDACEVIKEIQDLRGKGELTKEIFVSTFRGLQERFDRENESLANSSTVSLVEQALIGGTK